jgi:hypothetical protein
LILNKVTFVLRNEILTVIQQKLTLPELLSRKDTKTCE